MGPVGAGKVANWTVLRVRRGTLRGASSLAGGADIGGIVGGTVASARSGSGIGSVGLAATLRG